MTGRRGQPRDVSGGAEDGVGNSGQAPSTLGGLRRLADLAHLCPSFPSLIAFTPCRPSIRPASSFTILIVNAQRHRYRALLRRPRVARIPFLQPRPPVGAESFSAPTFAIPSSLTRLLTQLALASSDGPESRHSRTAAGPLGHRSRDCRTHVSRANGSAYGGAGGRRRAPATAVAEGI